MVHQTFIINEYHLQAVVKEELQPQQILYYCGYLFRIEAILSSIDKILVYQLGKSNTYFLFEINRVFTLLLDYAVLQSESQCAYYRVTIVKESAQEDAYLKRFASLAQ